MTDRTTLATSPVTGRPFLARPDPQRASLVVVVYHYVRDPGTALYPRINGLTVAQFAAQVAALQERYEMATLDSALGFLDGERRNGRSLCLLTFDDGLKEHAYNVVPILGRAGIQGVFFATTSCLAGQVASVHKNHHLMAALGFEQYRHLVMERLEELNVTPAPPDPAQAALAYPWDTRPVAAFKHLMNFRLSTEWRTLVVDQLFAEYLGDEPGFARELYLSSADARRMQRAGMIIGGHSHAHLPLAGLDAALQARDLAQCGAALRASLLDQAHWPFSYPYGVFDANTESALPAAGFDSGFALEGGDNHSGRNRYQIHRVDPKDLTF